MIESSSHGTPWFRLVYVMAFLVGALIFTPSIESATAATVPVVALQDNEEGDVSGADEEKSDASDDESETGEEGAADDEKIDMTSPAIKVDVEYTINTLIMLVCAILVIFMQAGFGMLEIGLNAAKNTINIIFKNVMDLSVGVLLFLLVGWGLMYPGDDAAGGIFGFGGMFVQRDAVDFKFGQTYSESASFMFQVAFAATAATIVSGAVAGRMKFGAYLIYSAILTGLVYPISGMWKWGGGFLEAWGFADFAGSIVVHALGGFAGLAGAIVLGARIGRFTKDGKSVPIPGHNIAFAALGVFVLWVGWYGFNPGSQLTYFGAANAEVTSYIALTTTLAAASGAVVAMVLSWFLFKKPDVTMALNGILAGLVGITANCDQVSQGSAILIGAVAGGLVVAGIVALDKLKIDDPVGAFPVHGLCGFWGGIATGIFGTSIPEGKSRLGYFLVQLEGSVIICAWAFITMFALFYVLKLVGFLRVTEEEELMGLDICEHGMHAYQYEDYQHSSSAGPPIGTPVSGHPMPKK